MLSAGMLALANETARRASGRAARRCARGAGLWLDRRFEGLSPLDALIYDRVFAPALGLLYRHAADDVTAALASRAWGDGATILDLGCGPGGLAVELVARLPEARIIGLDLSPSMIERAKRHESEGGRLRFIVGDVADLPFEAETFDVVVSTLSLHHWAEPAASLAEIRRVLRPGGFALLYDFQLITLESTALADVSRTAGLRLGDLRREPLGGGPVGGVFVRFRLQASEIPADPA
jgi:SAM-dependent methyltransferase